MSNKDFQNGIALGLAMGGVVSEKILDHTVTFTVDGEPYEIVSVKNGNSVNAPQTIPTKNGSVFGGWLNADSEIIIFPCVPTTEVVLNATFLDIPTDYILYVPLKNKREKPSIRPI